VAPSGWPDTFSARTLSVQAWSALDHSSVIRRKGGVPMLIGSQEPQ
jgi:hypothetical protein